MKNMYDLRSDLIVTKTISMQDVAMDADACHKTIQKLKEELVNDIPSLKTLKASLLKFEISPNNSQLTVRAMLKELDHGELRDTKTGLAICDPYSADLERVKADQRNTDLRLVSAMNPGATPHLEPSVKKARRRLRKARLREDEDLWMTPAAKSIPLFDTALYLPNSPLTRGEIRVLSLTPTKALVELIHTVSFNTQDEQAQVVEKGTRVNLLRPKMHQSLESGSVLQHHMDRAAPLEVEFAVVIRWDSGEISHLELMKFLSPT